MLILEISNLESLKQGDCI